MMRLLMAALLSTGIAPCLLAVDVAAWVAQAGGRVTTDSASRIVGVDLSYTWISDSDLDLIAGLTDLRALNLSCVRITDRGIERLRALPNVEWLDLHSAEHITDFALTYLRNWKKLKRLDLGGTDITDTGLEFVAELESLEWLNVSMTQATDNGIDHLAALSRLRELRIGGNVMTARALMALRVLPALVSLDLSGVQRRNSGVWQVSLTDLDMELFATFERLEALNLRGRKLTDVGAAQLARMKKLRSLNLSETALTSRGLEPLVNLPELRELSLAEIPRIDDTAAPLLQKMKLESLDLTRTGVSDSGIEKIATALSLRHLWVGGSKVSKDGFDRLSKLNPPLQVSWWVERAPPASEAPQRRPGAAKPAAKQP